MDKTDKLLKQMRPVETHADIASAGGGNDFIIPNISGRRDKLLIGDCFFTADATNIYLKNSAGTAILTINLTTGNITQGGTQKYIYTSKVIGV